MATHARTGFDRLLAGSVAEEVLRRSPAPVLLVPPGAAALAPSDGTVRVLVALDGSPLAEAALEPASELAPPSRLELLLLRVAEPPGRVRVRRPLAGGTTAPRSRVADGVRQLRSAGAIVTSLVRRGRHPPTRSPKWPGSGAAT